MVWIILLLWLVAFVFLIWKLPFFRKSGLTPHFLVSAFVLKILAGSALTLLYTYYYTDRSSSDIWKYYDDAEVIYGSLKINPIHYFELITGINDESEHLQHYYKEMKNWSPQSEQWLEFTQTKNYNFFNSNRFVTRFNALVRPASGGNIFVNIVVFCFISLVGLTAFYRQMRPLVPGKELLAVVCIFLLPSTLLWCSGVLKDGFILCFINLLVYQLFPPTIGSSDANSSVIQRILAVLLLSWVIILSKYYVLIALLPGILAFVILRIRKFKRPFFIYSGGVVFLLFFSILISAVLPDYSGWNVLARKREESLKSAIFADANNYLFTDKTDNDWYSVVSRIPESLVNAIFRPFINEVDRSPMLLLAASENLLIVILMLWMISGSYKGINRSETAWFFLSFSLLLAFIIGFTTPVTGGIVRYKTAFIPYLLMAGVIITKLNIPYSGKSKFRNLIIRD